MNTTIFQSRLAALSSSHKHIIHLINRLRTLSDTPAQGDEGRVELGAEIHQDLKTIEDGMELLRVEMEQLERTHTQRNGIVDAEKERIITMAGKFEEDLKITRTQFRTAQLEAKRNAEAARQKERQLLFQEVKQGGGSSRKTGTPKFTHDDLVADASNDVTAALRQTHQLMQAELSRSQFAQQTLNQSTQTLDSLSESYSNLDTVLESSRSLVSSLLRSQKSDTWYLETAFYILIGTITWLLFRRIFYGPLWWLLWQPLKLIYQFTFTILGAVGLSNTALSPAFPNIAPAGHGVSGHISQSPIPTNHAGTGSISNQAASYHQTSVGGGDTHKETIEENIARIVEEDKGTNVDDISPEERRRQEEMPRNPKKRMWEEKIEEQGGKDEL